MNVYAVWMPDKDGRVLVATTGYYGGYEPPEPVGMVDVVAAETRGGARHQFIRCCDVAEAEDWNFLRVRKVAGDVEGLKPGSVPYGHPAHDQGWLRIHEIFDHDGRECDCPEVSLDEYENARVSADERYARERQRVADLAGEAARRLTDDLVDLLLPGARVGFGMGNLLHDDRGEV